MNWRVIGNVLCRISASTDDIVITLVVSVMDVCALLVCIGEMVTEGGVIDVLA